MMQEEVDALTRQQVLQSWRIEQREPYCCPSVSEHLVVSVKGCTESVGVTLIEDVVLMEAWRHCELPW